MSLTRTAIIVLVFSIPFYSHLGGMEFENTIGIDSAYYMDNHDGGTGSAPFFPSSYKPLNPNNSIYWDSGPYVSPETTGIPRLTGPQTRSLGNGSGEFKGEIYYKLKMTFPFLRNGIFLFKDNNLTVILKPSVSPVSLLLKSEIQWQPIAFFKMFVGGSVGTGWRLNSTNILGLYMNDSDSLKIPDENGYFSSFHAGGTLQFDLNALVPGNYTHVVFSLMGKARYINYSKASFRQAWYWRADSGRNFNGWKYVGRYVIGWKPPWKINFLGMIIEHEFWLSPDIRNMAPLNATFNPVDNKGYPTTENWGSDTSFFRFGPAVNINIARGHSLLILFQFRNGFYYAEGTSYARWFRRHKATGRSYITMERLAIAYSWTF